MDIGDIIFFLIIVGLPLVQWLTRKKEGTGEGEPFPAEDFRPYEDAGQPGADDSTYRPKRDVSDPNREWEDLMEALGRPRVETEPAPPLPPVEPRRQAPPSAPPPVPTAPAPAFPALDPRVERLNRALREQQSREQRRPQPSSMEVPRTTARPRMTTGSAGHRVQGILRNPQSIRDAILVNEILATPVSMRPYRT